MPRKPDCRRGKRHGSSPVDIMLRGADRGIVAIGLGLRLGLELANYVQHYPNRQSVTGPGDTPRVT